MLLIHVLLLCLIYCGNSASAQDVHPDKCGAVDVVFLVDNVRTIGRGTLRKEKELVKNIVDNLPDQSKVAIFSYSNGLKKELTLDQEQTTEAALSAVDTIRFGPSSHRNTHRAINKARVHLKNFGRDGFPHVIIYVTAGPSAKPESAVKSADKARRNGITLFAVGLGRKVNSTELSQLAFENREPFVLDNRKAIHRFMDDLKDCSETPEPTQSTSLPTTESFGSTSGYDEFDEGTSDTFEDFSTSVLLTSSYGGFSETYYPSSSYGDYSESYYPSSSYGDYSESYYPSSSYGDYSESYYPSSSYGDYSESYYPSSSYGDYSESYYPSRSYGDYSESSYSAFSDTEEASSSYGGF